MSGSGREALLDVREWSGDPSRMSGVVERLSRMSLSGERPFRMSGSGREAISDVLKLSGVPPESPGDPPG